jgi:flagellar protein FlaG
MNVNPVQSPAPEASRPVAARTAVSSTPASAQTQAPAAPADPTTVKDAVKAANEAVKTIKSELSFSVDDDTGKTVVRVVEKQTGTLIRQIPSQEMLEIAQALDRLQGLLVRNSA